MRRPTPRRFRLASLGLVAAGALLAIGLSPEFALSVLPALALVVALILGAFPGAELIDWLRECRSRPTGRRRPVDTPRQRCAPYVRPAGRAMAFALAMRPPPAAAARA